METPDMKTDAPQLPSNPIQKTDAPQFDKPVIPQQQLPEKPIMIVDEPEVQQPNVEVPVMPKTEKPVFDDRTTNNSGPFSSNNDSFVVPQPKDQVFLPFSDVPILPNMDKANEPQSKVLSQFGNKKNPNIKSAELPPKIDIPMEFNPPTETVEANLPNAPVVKADAPSMPNAPQVNTPSMPNAP
jgi:hypothetical protein